MKRFNLLEIQYPHMRICAEIHKACFDQPWGLEAFQQTFDAPLGIVGWLALENDSPIGFILGRLFACEMEITTLAVLPSHHNQGVASLLLSKCFSLNPKTIFLEVNTHNKAAISLYKKRSFQQIGIRPRYYKNNSGSYDDAVLMLWRNR